MILGVPAGSQLGEWLGWEKAFLVNAGFGFAVLLSQFLLVPSLPTHEAVGLRHMRALFSVSNARIGLLTTLFLFAGYTFFEPFLRSVKGVDQSAITALLLVYGVFGIGGNFFAEAAARQGIRRAFAVVAVMLGVTILLGGLFVDGLLFTYILAAAWGFAFGAVPVCMQIWMYQSAPDNYESGAALFVSVAQISLALGALSGGLMIDAIGQRGTLICAGSLCLIAAVLLVGLSRRSESLRPIFNH